MLRYRSRALGSLTGRERAPGRCPTSPPPLSLPPPPQTDEAVRALLQRFYALQGERVEAYRLLEE